MNLIRHVFDTVQFLFKKYLFWAALSVATCGLSLIAGIGVCPLLAVVGWWLLLLQGTDCRCIAFSNCCWLWSTGLVAVGSGLVASQHVESSQAEIQLVSPALAGRFFNHWNTSEAHLFQPNIPVLRISILTLLEEA